MTMGISLFKKAFVRFHEVNAYSLGAALAYFAIFSLVPLLTVLILIVGIFLNHDFIISNILIAFESALGQNVASLLSSALQNPIHYSHNPVINMVGVGAFVFAILTLTAHLQNSLNAIFGFQKEEVHLFYVLFQKAFLLFMVFLLAVLLFAVIVIGTILSYISSVIYAYIPYASVLVQSTDYLISFLFVIGFCSINFRFLPHGKISWRAILYGSLVTSVLFLVGKSLFSIYVNSLQPGSVFGGAGVILVILLWVYYSSQSLFFGASVAYQIDLEQKEETH